MDTSVDVHAHAMGSHCSMRNRARKLISGARHAHMPLHFDSHAAYTRVSTKVDTSINMSTLVYESAHTSGYAVMSGKCVETCLLAIATDIVGKVDSAFAAARHVHRHACGRGVGMCRDICRGMCRGVCRGICRGMCRGMCIDMHTDIVAVTIPSLWQSLYQAKVLSLHTECSTHCALSGGIDCGIWDLLVTTQYCEYKGLAHS